MFKKLLRKLGSIVLTVLVFGYIIFEELVWENIAKPIYDFVHSLKILQKVEVAIQKLHRWALLVIFLLLFVQVEFLGFAALALLAKGKVIGGVLLYVGRIPLGVFTFWLFSVSKDKLMTFSWFERLYEFMKMLINKIKTSKIYKNIKEKSSSLKHYFKTRYFGDGFKFKEKIKKVYQNIKI